MEVEFYNVTLDVTPRPPARSIAPAPTLGQVQALQVALSDLPQTECPLEHQFGGGMYMRKCKIPAGQVVVGKMHRHAHPVLLVKGEATILTDKGMERITAPHEWMSQPGAKRPVLTHTDCEFVTVHLNPDETQDLEVLEADLIVPEPQLTNARPELPDFSDELQGVYA